MSSREARLTRLHLSARIVSQIRSNNQNGLFSAQELLHIENLLRDEFVTNQWLFNVCNAISDDSVFVTNEECDLYDKYQSEEQSITVSKAEVKELQNKLQFLKEKIIVLRYICNDLNHKLKDINRNDSQNGDEGDNSERSIKSHLNLKLEESLALLKEDISSQLTITDPKEVVEEMVNQLNQISIKNDGNNRVINWFRELMDHLVLSYFHLNKRQLLEILNSELSSRLQSLKQSLLHLHKECLRIKDFYDINVREEISWREDLKQLLDQMQDMSAVAKLTLPQIISESNESNQLSAKKQIIENNSKLMEKLENEESDEFESLINALKERIEILSLQMNKEHNS